MSVYEKQTWVDGVTPADAEHFNHMENGIAANAETVGKAISFEAQTLTEEQKAQARANIGVSESGGGSAEGAVLYTPQTLTEEQQNQARGNIGAAPMSLFKISNASGDNVDVLTSIKPEADALTLGLYFDRTSGKEVNNENWYSTEDFIQFPDGAGLIAHYSANNDKYAFPTVIFYDENKNYLAGQYYGSFESEEYDGKYCIIYDVPENTRYIRVSYQKQYVDRYYEHSHLWSVTQQHNESVNVEIPNLIIPNIAKLVKSALLPYCKARFDDSFNYIAYSQIYASGISINTAEHFEWAANQGFTALKGDVRPTSDGGLIMCHDAGFTLNTDGKVREYAPSSEDYTTVTIHDMTEAECLALQHVNTDSHVCNFETFIRICKKHGKIAFITIRDEYMDKVVPKMFEILDKYSMRKRSIVNSFTVPSLEAVRAADDDIMLSNVLNDKTVLTKAHINKAIALGNCLICTFLFPFDYDNDDNGDGNLDGFDALERSLEALAYAQKKDIRIYSAINNSASDVEKLMAYGVMGAQMTVVPSFDSDEI
jgi:hypothetical protein